MANFNTTTFMLRESAEELGTEPEYCGLHNNQPLLLSCGPTPRVYVSAMDFNPVGYLNRTDGPGIYTRLSNGEILLAKVKGDCQCDFRLIEIWSEGEQVVKEKKRVKETTE